MATGLTVSKSDLKGRCEGFRGQIQEKEKRELGIYVEEHKTGEKIYNQELSKLEAGVFLEIPHAFPLLGFQLC